MTQIRIVKNIKWDTDGEDIELPSELKVEIPKHLKDEEDILEFVRDEISNITGYCHFGFTIEPVKEESKHTPGEENFKLMLLHFFDKGLAFAHGTKSNASYFRFNTVFDQNKQVKEFAALLEENNRLKEINGELLKVVEEFIYNWEALGNGNDYTHTATKAKEAIQKAKN